MERRTAIRATRKAMKAIKAAPVDIEDVFNDAVDAAYKILKKGFKVSHDDVFKALDKLSDGRERY